MINNIAVRHDMAAVSSVSVTILCYIFLQIEFANCILSFTVLDMRQVVMLQPVMSLSPKIK